MSGQMCSGRRVDDASVSSQAAAGEKKMRSTGLLGFNALAIAAFAAPALLILASAGPSLAHNPAWTIASLVSVLAGCVSLFLSMLKISAGRIDAAFVSLLMLGLILVAAPVTAFVAVGPFG